MKIVAILGSNNNSINRKLLDFTIFSSFELFQIEELQINDLPLFSESLDINNFTNIIELSEKIKQADGVLIVTSEYNHTIPAILKNFLEWMSHDLRPFIHKPVQIIGSSENYQGSSRAQVHLKQILDSPGIDAFVMPANEFILSNAKEKFDQDGRLVDEKTADYLEHILLKFQKYIDINKSINFDDLDSKYQMTLRAGGYINLDDPHGDGFASASEY